ncbi:MAG: DnaJ domain-containing protein, partial [Gallionella sp.]
SLAMRHHPDRSTHSNSEARFNAIKNAYEVLSIPKLRSEYNQSLNNRIILDPDGESRILWQTLFERCGVSVPHDDQPQR